MMEIVTLVLMGLLLRIHPLEIVVMQLLEYIVVLMEEEEVQDVLLQDVLHLHHGMVAGAAGQLLIYVTPVVPQIIRMIAVYAENVRDFHNVSSTLFPNSS
jgi:hypothetical protein